jgi:hypothetical protein
MALERVDQLGGMTAQHVRSCTENRPPSLLPNGQRSMWTPLTAALWSSRSPILYQTTKVGLCHVALIPCVHAVGSPTGL